MVSQHQSLQGRRLETQTFPSPGHVPSTFLSRSRCLIDMGSVLIVLTEGANDAVGQPDLAYQRMLYRLEINPDVRGNVAFVDESQMTKADCEEILTNELKALTNCQIVGLRFPFFDEGNKHKTKYRPCVALYGDPAGPALYLPIYMGVSWCPESASRPWEICLKGPGDLAPASAPDSIVDVSKLCGMPEEFHRTGDQVHGKQTWNLFFLNNDDQRSILSAARPESLREKVVQALIEMIRQKRSSYIDATRELDVGSWVESLELLDGEWCVGLEQYGIPSSSTS